MLECKVSKLRINIMQAYYYATQENGIKTVCPTNVLYRGQTVTLTYGQTLHGSFVWYESNHIGNQKDYVIVYFVDSIKIYLNKILSRTIKMIYIV